MRNDCTQFHAFCYCCFSGGARKKLATLFMLFLVLLIPVVIPFLFALSKSVSNGVVTGVHIFCALFCYYMFYLNFEGNSIFWLFFFISLLFTLPASGFFIGFIDHHRCEECRHFSMKCDDSSAVTRYTCYRCGYSYTESKKNYSSSSRSSSSSSTADEEYLIDEYGRKIYGYYHSSDIFKSGGSTYR